jgi:hypothetical protein
MFPTLGFCAEMICDWSRPAALNLVYPAKSELRDPVAVQFAYANGLLTARFEVRATNINAKSPLEEGEYPYQFDVVELFVSAAGSNNLPYYEFELSPLNQTFQVKVVDPRESYIDGVEMDIRTHTEKTAFGWIGTIEIPLVNLLWTGDIKDVVGNAYAVQGMPHQRSYWSLYLPQQKKPRFHLPEFFRPLLDCSR